MTFNEANAAPCRICGNPATTPAEPRIFGLWRAGTCARHRLAVDRQPRERRRRKR